MEEAQEDRRVDSPPDQGLEETREDRRVEEFVHDRGEGVFLEDRQREVSWECRRSHDLDWETLLGGGL